jgi:hypothetical protein
MLRSRRAGWQQTAHPSAASHSRARPRRCLSRKGEPLPQFGSGRFRIKPYPKDRSAAAQAQCQHHRQAAQARHRARPGEDDLLFAMPESTRPESHYLPFAEGKADQISKSRHAHRTASRVPLDGRLSELALFSLAQLMLVTNILMWHAGRNEPEFGCSRSRLTCSANVASTG